MSKIISFCLGVFSSFSVLSVYANEKFEVLPDLPEALSYAVQPAAASTVKGGANTTALVSQSVGQEPNILSVLLSLAIVILLIYLTGIVYAKLNKVGFKTMKKQQGEFAKSHVSVLSTTQLGSNKTLHVVELDGKRMLIGASSGAIQLIKDLGGSYDEADDGEYSRIEIPNIKIPKIEIPKIEIPSIGFSKLVTKTHKPIKDVEESVTENVEPEKNEKEVAEALDVENVENETPEVIIDSLFAQQDLQPEETMPDNKTTEHIVDPDDFALYKKYLS